ncbi:MAG: rane-flanked domain protein, partial [Marmoricola sp.]|nr:rane-flanked domain protein [Marmoricola sp.]
MRPGDDPDAPDALAEPEGPSGPAGPAGQGAPGETPWRRLDARMLLVHPVTEVVRFLPALIGVFVVGGTGDDGTPAWWQVASVVLPVALGMLRWVTTRFRVTASRVELRRGLLRRAELSARVDRVRAVELTATPVHRLLGLSRVEIGVGSTTSEDTGFVLDGLGRAEAAALRSALLTRAVPHRTAPGAGAALTGPAGPTGPTGPVGPGGATAGPAGATAAGTSGAPGAPAHPAPAGATGTAYALHPPGQGDPWAAPEEVLLRLDPTWARYAPLTASGNVVVLGL